MLSVEEADDGSGMITTPVYLCDKAGEAAERAGTLRASTAKYSEGQRSRACAIRPEDYSVIGVLSEGKISMEKFKADFIQTFIDGNRWKALLNGLGVTLEVTFLALLIGAVLGVLVAVIRSSHDQMEMQHKKNTGLSILNGICQLYLTVIRGTPVMVQLLIMYFVIMSSSTNTILVATLSFGINFGAYVAEIIR